MARGAQKGRGRAARIVKSGDSYWKSSCCRKSLNINEKLSQTDYRQNEEIVLGYLFVLLAVVDTKSSGCVIACLTLRPKYLGVLCEERR